MITWFSRNPFTCILKSTHPLNNNKQNIQLTFCQSFCAYSFKFLQKSGILGPNLGQLKMLKNLIFQTLVPLPPTSLKDVYEKVVEQF